jgi:hypothetical protein
MRIYAFRVSVVVCLIAVAASGYAAGLSCEVKRVSVGGKSFSARVVRVPLASYRVKVALAGGRVGATESLAAIAKRNGAAAAINGCFFDAYTKDPVKLPYHNLMTGGEVVHIGNTGTTLGFDSNGDYRMDRARFLIRGEANGKSWYAYFVNRPGGASMFNRFCIGSKTPAEGTKVVVRGDVAQFVCAGSVPVPFDGYVLSFSGGESSMAGRFAPGAPCSRRREVGGADPEFWSHATEAIGCGPRLVSRGEVCCDPVSEGFSSYKILSMSGARSAVGVTRDRVLLLVTCSCTVRDLAGVMKALGAYDAMNLDGGASSGLYVNGRSVVTPGRLISNALVVVKR